jgi:hypothetical protein
LWTFFFEDEVYEHAPIAPAQAQGFGQAPAQRACG